MACLDTTTLLDTSAAAGARFRRPARALLADLIERGEQLCTTRFNVAELYVGIERSRDHAREAERVATVLRANRDGADEIKLAEGNLAWRELAAGMSTERRERRPGPWRAR